MASKNWKDLDLSVDEVTRIGEALKDEKFRQLFIEYAEEISDPENRRRYEEEISEMERERGMDVQFIHPKPGYVLKTSINGKDKAFINICENDKIEKPSSKPEVSSDGRRGLHWQIPHSHSHPREDVIKEGEKCQIFDVVYHPDTIRMTENPRFKKMVEDIAIEGIESRFDVSVDKKNIKYMKNIKYKGIPVATVKRSKNEDGPKQSEASEILKDMPYPYDNKTSAEKAKEMMDQVKKKQEKQSKNTKNSNKNEPDGPTEPKYTIIHRSNMDLQEYRNSPDARTSTRPKELEIQIELPLLNSAMQVDLDVFEQKILLKSDEPAKYKLELKLPYPVDDENGSARFDKSKRRLILTLPVQPPQEVALPSFIDENEKTSQDQLVAQTDLVTTEESKLIEELPPLEEIEETNISQETCPKNESDSSNTLESRDQSASSKSYPKPQITYSFPDFTFSQDDETVSFVLNVRNVSHESVSKSFQRPNVCQIKFMTLGKGGYPMHYSFLVHFADDKQIIPDHCSSDVSDLNVVLLLLKARDARGSWTDFQAGTSMDDLQDYLFVTESSLQKELDQLEAETVGNQHIEHPVANIHVTEMNKKKLSIKVQKANRKGKKEDRDVNLDVQGSSQTEEEDIVEEDLPSSAGIEIFHEKNTPNLHGILKQRSVSESSDDLSSSQGSCSPISPRDDASKKSVHFNDRIDKTTFKPGTAVTSMTKALKSKRRRNRKRDEKKNGRLRQNSGGSEGSTSGEELDLCRTSVTEEEEEGEFCDQVIEDIQKEEASNEEKKEISEVKEKNKIDDCVKGTSLPTENEVQMKVKAIKDKISKERTNSNKADSDDDDESDKIKSGDLIIKSGDGDFRTTKNKCANEESVKVDKSVKESEKAEAANGMCSERENENDAKLNESVDRVREPVEGTKVVAAGDVLNNKNILDLQDKDTTVLKIVQDDKQNGNDSGVECGLEGGDTHGEVQGTKTQGDGGPEDLNSIDHRTQCAFQFSNALMFDLDVD